MEEVHYSLMTLVINAVPSMGVSGAHHLFLLASVPLIFGTAHFAFRAFLSLMLFQVCEMTSKVSRSF